MGVREHARLSVLALWVVPLIAVLAIAAGYLGPATASAEGDGPTMALSVSGSDVSCDGDVCSAPLGGDFTLTVDVVQPPEQGYILMQTFVDYGEDLSYFMTDAPIDEVVWPDAAEDIVLRGALGPGVITHGGLTSLLPPQPVSTYVGAVVELAMGCSDSFSETTVQLRPLDDPLTGGSGTLFTYLEGVSDVQVVPKVASVTVVCGEAEPANGGPGAEPTALPPSGTGGMSSDGGAGTGFWIMFAILLGSGAIGLTLSGWSVARSRQLR